MLNCWKCLDSALKHISVEWNNLKSEVWARITYVNYHVVCDIKNVCSWRLNYLRSLRVRNTSSFPFFFFKWGHFRYWMQIIQRMKGKALPSFDVLGSQDNMRDLQKLALKYCCDNGIWLPAVDTAWLNAMDFSSGTKSFSWRTI